MAALRDFKPNDLVAITFCDGTPPLYGTIILSSDSGVYLWTLDTNRRLTRRAFWRATIATVHIVSRTHVGKEGLRRYINEQTPQALAWAWRRIPGEAIIASIVRAEDVFIAQKPMSNTSTLKSSALESDEPIDLTPFIAALRQRLAIWADGIGRAYRRYRSARSQPSLERVLARFKTCPSLANAHLVVEGDTSSLELQRLSHATNALAGWIIPELLTDPSNPVIHWDADQDQETIGIILGRWLYLQSEDLLRQFGEEASSEAKTTLKVLLSKLPERVRKALREEYDACAAGLNRDSRQGSTEPLFPLFHELHLEE